MSISTRPFLAPILEPPPADNIGMNETRFRTADIRLAKYFPDETFDLTAEGSGTGT